MRTNGHTRPASCWRVLLPAILPLLVLLPLAGRAAIITTEDFDAGAAGWGSRDDLLSVSANDTDERLEGSFAGQFFPVDQTDAFQLSSGDDFLGSYAGITQISFDFFAVNILPSDMFIRLIDDEANVFTYQLTPTTPAGQWQSFTVDLAWSFGWEGDSESAFNTALGDIDFIEIELTRNGMGAQTFYLDSFETLDTPLDGGGGEGDGESVIPEPQTLSLLVAAAIMVVRFRRKRQQQASGG